MYSHPELAIKYLTHTWRASNGRGHGIHSPFVFDFVKKVLNDKRSFYAFTAIERLRAVLRKDQRIITVEDFGQPGGALSEKKIRDIARRSLSSPKFGQLLFRTANHYRPKHILELGSSLGISGAYLASADPEIQLTTLEGSASVAAVATENFKRLNLQPIRQLTGNFEETLGEVLDALPPVEFVFIDGHHQKIPVLNYFRQLMDKRSRTAVFIFHDIHWSRDMEDAWQTIRSHPEVMLSVDLFTAGFVFFQDAFRVKQHFDIRC